MSKPRHRKPKVKKRKSTARCKLLLDEGFPPPSRFPDLRKYHNLTHIRDTHRKAQIKDPKLYEFAVEQGRHLITFNGKDFKKIKKSRSTNDTIAIFYVTQNMTYELIDKKISAHLRNHKSKELVGASILISNESGKEKKT